MNRYPVVILVLLSFSLGWGLRGYYGDESVQQNESTGQQSSEDQAIRVGPSSLREGDDSQWAENTLKAIGAGALADPAETAMAETLVQEVLSLIRQSRFEEASILLEEYLSRLDQDAGYLLGQSYVEQLESVGFENFIINRSMQTLGRLISSLSPYAPSTQFFDVINQVESNPVLALDSFDALSSYYQEQISSDQLSTLEAWLLARAEHFYRESEDWPAMEEWLQALIARSTNPADAYAELAAFYFERGRYLASLEALDTVSNYRGWSADEEQLYDHNKLSISRQSLSIIPLVRVDGHYIVDIELDGRMRVPLLLDTGASISSLDEAFARENRFRFIGRSLTLATAGGLVNSELVGVRSLQIGDRELPWMELATVDFGSASSETDYFGLLGMDVLGRFQFYIDQREAILYLSDFADQTENHIQRWPAL